MNSNVLLFSRALLDKLIFASKSGDVGVVQELIAAGAPLNTPLKSPLHHAAEYGHVETVKVLLAAGADVNARFYYSTPLHFAVSNKQLETVKVLLAAGASVKSKHKSCGPLHPAARHASTEIIKLLLDAGASVHDTDHNNLTPLHHAIHNNPEAVKMLLAAGADPNPCNWPFEVSTYYITYTLGSRDALLQHRLCGVISALMEGGALLVGNKTKDTWRDPSWGTSPQVLELLSTYESLQKIGMWCL